MPYTPAEGTVTLRKSKAARKRLANKNSSLNGMPDISLEKVLLLMQERMSVKNKDIRYVGIRNGIAYMLAGWITAVIIRIIGNSGAMYAIPASFIIGLLGYFFMAARNRSRKSLSGIGYYAGSWILAQAAVIAGGIYFLGR